MLETKCGGDNLKILVFATKIHYYLTIGVGRQHSEDVTNITVTDEMKPYPILSWKLNSDF